ncbi:Integrin alpha-PS1 [Gryllus bimaculatus]|nr:Integrin alpha-PS1 [Gryllus bimaculatus]
MCITFCNSKFIFLNMKLVFLVTVLLYGRLYIECFNIGTEFPIIYSRPLESLPGRNSYFGFSLLLNKNWIQIGAPRANSTILGNRVMEPGVAYRCTIFGACTEVELDRNVNRLRDDNPSVKDLKNFSWIGGAMAMEHGSQGKVVVCGHRWKNQQNLNPKHSLKKTFNTYAMSGICYISIYESESVPKFKYTLPSEVYDRDGKTYNGGVLEYAREPKTQIASRRRRDIPRTEFGPYTKIGFIDEFVFNQFIDQFNFFGYQVAAGYFFSQKELLHVAGAPRAYDMKGLVAIYSIGNRHKDVKLIDVKKGQSFGEYFGSTLAVADVTGDGFDDLIIGAPFFSLHGDEGCIYVFTKSVTYQYTVQYFLQEKEKKTGFAIGGRFGTSMASLGDIDQDGRGDIAVGAPYEESGVVYIFNGAPNGLSSKPSQRIAASDIHKSIRGFGISFSRPADIDENKFTDVAIGSYLSEHVVILRSYPVIELHSYIRSYTKQFNMSHTSFMVEPCIFYKGSENVPNDIEVVREIDVDTNFHRFLPIPEKSFVLANKSHFHCEKIIIQKKRESDSIHDLNDITIGVTQRLKYKGKKESIVLWVNGSSPVKDADKFCRFCPVVREIHSDVINIPYARDCGDDGVCESDAQLQCQLLQNDILLKTAQQPFLSYNYIIGSYPNLKLMMHVHNKGDTLYSPKVKIYIPEQVELAQMSLMCQDKKNGSLEVTCGFGPITDGKMKSNNISLDLSSYETLRTMSEKGESLLIKANISQDNYEDLNPRNNHCNIRLNLIMMADVNITGKSVQDEFFSESEKKQKAFTHIYEVLNVGISPLRQVQTFFQIPVEWLESSSSIQLSSPTVEAQQNGKSIFCKLVKANMEMGQNTYQKDASSVKNKNAEGISLTDTHPSNRTFYVNCSSPNVKCQTWSCNFFEFKNNTIARIEIVVRFNVSRLVPILGNKDIISFSTHGHVKMIESNNTQRPNIMSYHDITVSSFAIGTVTDETIPLWIIILCIVAGILLIAAIVVGLSKAGFFKRKKKEELKALKESEVFGYNVDTNFPLIYKDPFRNPFGRSSYFGYSVLLSKTWIQIGAPRGNFSTEGMKIIEPGVVYHCKFGEPWVQLSLGKSLSNQGFSISRESWFGIAMDFEPGITGQIVVCGHRWMNVSFPKDIPGACYSFQSNDDLTRISNILTPTSSANKDKHIAVGAPYEGNGVVYIYYGRSTGLKGPHQRIPAEDLYKNLRGFGNSFSGQITTAGNYYNGIAVGSFLSGHAVILRTLPVVTVSTHIKPVTRQLSHAVSQAIVDVCVHFSGTNVSRLNITQRISADRSFGRAKPAYIHDTLLLDVNEEKCQNYTFHVLFKPDLVHQSMVFLLSAQVTNTSEAAKRKDILYVQEDGSISGYDGFQFQDPIQKISSGSSETTLEIPYSQDCKNDVCEPDLQLKCYILQNGNKFNLTQTFVIGSKAKYQLQIDVTNSGEPSYTTLAEIKFSKEIQLASIPYMCTEIDEATSCQLGIIKKSNNRNIILDLDMSSVDELNTDEDRALYITVNVSTAAKDKNLVNNFQQLNLNLSLDVDAHIYGKSQKDNYAISKFDNGSFASVLEIAQIFEIHKKGDSPLNMLEMTMKVPVNVINGKQEIQVISFHKPDGIIDNKYWDCNADFGCTNCQNVFQREFEVPESAVSENVRIKRSFPEEILIDKEKAPPSNRTLYINCSSEYTNCTTVRCQTTDLEDYGKVTLRLKVDIAKLGPFMGQKDIIYITSEGEVKILYPDITSVKNIQQKWSHVAQASSQIIGKIPKKKVDLWIIIASIIGGILIAMVVAMGLAKAGFFQRKTKTELEQLKERSRNSQMPAQQMSVLDADLDTNGTELH